MKRIGFIVVALLAYSINLGQEPLSLLECVHIAINNSLNIQQAEIDLRAAEYNIAQSKLERIPSLNANSSHSLNFGRSLDFTSYEFNTQTTQSNSFGISAGTLLFGGGRVTKTIELQQLLANRNESNIQSLKDQLAINVAANFLQVLSAKEQIKTSEAQLDFRQKELDRTKRLIDAGTLPGSNLYDIEAQYTTTEYQLNQAKNTYQIALLNLKQSMLYPFDQPLTIEAPNIEIPNIDMVRNELNPTTVFNHALLTQGSIQSANQEVLIAQKNVELAEANRVPTISLGAGMNTYHSDQAKEIIGTEIAEQRIPIEGISIPGQDPYISFINSVPIQQQSPFFDQLSNNLSQNIGLNVQIPIFQKGQIKNQIQQAELTIDRSKINAQLQERQLLQQIETAYLEAELAYKTYQSARYQVEAQTKSANFAEKRYKIGSATIYDYLTTQNNLTLAEIQLTQAKYDYIYKVKVLEFYKENNYTF